MKVGRLKHLLPLLALPVLVITFVTVHPQLVHAAACTAPATDYGTDTLTVTIPSTATYRVWTRMAAPDATNNTYLLDVDSTSCYTVGGSTVPTYTSGATTYFASGSTNWISKTSGGTQIDVSLSAGTHTFKMIGNAANVVVDRLVLTQDTTCIPTGTGDNCANPPDTTHPTVSQTSPTSGATGLSTTPTLTATASDDVAVKSVDFYVDGTKVGTDTTATAGSYSYTLTAGQALSSGLHQFYAIATDTSTNTTQSTTISASVGDTTPPTITSPAVGSITQTSATVTWTTNEAADSQVKYGTTSSYGSQTTLDTAKVTSHSVGISGLTANTTYHYQIVTKDAAGNSSTTTDATFTTLAVVADTTAPTVSITAPADGATVSGTAVSVTANASDNVGVVGVQFKLDGNNLGAEDTTSTYKVTWNTTGYANGNHTLTAVARDAAGNTKTATTITVTVNNPTYKSADINQDGAVNILDFSLLVGKFGQSGGTLGRADVNGDGTVNILDFSLLVGQFGT